MSDRHTPPDIPRYRRFPLDYGNREIVIHMTQDWTEEEIERALNRKRCPHGEPLGACHDCLKEHREATR